jgi:shikimate dehydrogenase
VNERTSVVLIGDPVAHSASPPMQQAAFDALGSSLVYTTLRVGRTELPGAFSALRRSAFGLNVTAPLKEAVIPLLDVVDPWAATAGSVNTVLFERGGTRGKSTDGDGFLDALAAAGLHDVGNAVVLGAGGAARAVAVALLSRGANIAIAGRASERLDRLVADLSGLSGESFRGARVDKLRFSGPDLAKALTSADLLVNATPVGAWPDPGQSPVSEAALHPGLAVFDLVYRPRRTRLLMAAIDRGCRVIEGVEMLVRQGARSFEVWTGRPAPVERMRTAALRALNHDPPARDDERSRVAP